MSNSDLNDIERAIHFIKRYCATTDMQTRVEVLQALALADFDAVALLRRVAERDNAAPKEKSNSKSKNAKVSQPSSFSEPSSFSKPEKPSTHKKGSNPLSRSGL
jgi:hypothetical protein